MCVNKNGKIISKTRKTIYRHSINILGIDKYKSKLIISMYNTCIYKKYNTINRLLRECNNRVYKYLTINVNVLKKNSIKFNNKRLNIIKN